MGTARPERLPQTSEGLRRPVGLRRAVLAGGRASPAGSGLRWGRAGAAAARGRGLGPGGAAAAAAAPRPQQEACSARRAGMS